MFLIFWFQILCGFSGSNMIEQWYLILFNLLFTSVPPLINGILDKDVSANSLMLKPTLYKQGMNDEVSYVTRVVIRKVSRFPIKLFFLALPQTHILVQYTGRPLPKCYYILFHIFGKFARFSSISICVIFF